MDNPWASSSEPPQPSKPWTRSPTQIHYQEADISLSSWSTDYTTSWTSPDLPNGTLWASEPENGDALSPTYEKTSLSHPALAEEDTTVHDPVARPMLSLPVPDGVLGATFPTDVSITFSAPSFGHNATVSTDDASGSVSTDPTVSASDEDVDTWGDSTLAVAADDEWGSAWTTAPSLESDGSNVNDAQPHDAWGSSSQEKEKSDDTLPPELLASLMQRCQQISSEIWPAPETNSDVSEEDWRTGFDGLENIAKLLHELIPEDLMLPPVQFRTSATAKAMKEALKHTRNSPLTSISPLARLLASKGSLNWERSVKSTQETVQDSAPIGWRVLEKEDRYDSSDDSKPKKVGGGLLAFWNRRVPSNPVADTTELSLDRSRSPAVSSIGSAKTTVQPQVSRDASPTKPSNGSMATRPVNNQPSPEVAVVTSPAAPSAVSRFLNRFSRAKQSSHGSLALSSDDLEFLSDIVPSANDPDDGQGDASLKDLFSTTKPSPPPPPKLPPPLPPPSRSPSTSRPSSVIGLGLSDNRGSAVNLQPQSNQSHTPQPLKLASPLMSTPFTSLSSPHSPTTPSIDTTPAMDISMLTSPMPTSLSFAATRSPVPLQSSSRPHSPFSLSPPLKAATSHPIPPLLPPPMPPSRTQTPRPSAIQPMSSTGAINTWGRKSFKDHHDAGDSEEEFSFSAFSSPIPSSPPSPPPRRLYYPTHVPSPSTSSILSPTSQNSADQLYSARSSISASFDDFDDFVTSPTRPSASSRSGIRTPSPPPLPSKHSSPRTDTSRIITSSSSVGFLDHQRTQSLVDHAAAQRGQWPNAPAVESTVKPIPPPPLADNLLGDLLEGDAFEQKDPSPASRLSFRGVGTTMKTSLRPSAVGPLVVPETGGSFGADGMRLSSSSPPPRQSTSPPVLAAFADSLQPSRPVKPTQTGGLSAQDLSFFEGL